MYPTYIIIVLVGVTAVVAVGPEQEYWVKVVVEIMNTIMVGFVLVEVASAVNIGWPEWE